MTASPFSDLRVVVRGGGDLGSGVAYRLRRCGFPILITELAHPLLIRRAVSFGSAAIDGTITVEGITARRVDSISAALQTQASGEIPALIDPGGACLSEYDPVIIVDARMLKANPGKQPVKASLIIGLGPGFRAPYNCDAVVETKRGHTLGRVFGKGAALADTGEPDPVLEISSTRVLRAPTEGRIAGLVPIGAIVVEGQNIARIDQHLVAAPISGALRGLIHDGSTVQAGTKIADIDPRGKSIYCFSISDKALAVGGGVLEAILSAPAIWPHLKGTSWR